MRLKKKRFVLLITLLALFVIFSACSGGGENAGTNETPSESESDPSEERPVFQYEIMNEYQNLPDENPTIKDREVMQRFDMELDINYVTLADGLEKMSILFASGNYPDAIFNLNHEAEVKKWGAAGYLVPMNEHLDQLQNYRNLWTDEDWELVMRFAANADGNLYYLPAQNYRTHSKAWIYRQDIFENLGLSFPETLDELYATLVALKAAYPDSVPLSNRSLDGVIGVAVNAYRLPGNMFYNFSGFYQDPDMDHQVMYAQATEKYRKALTYVNRLYEENLIEKEFPTMTSEQWTQRGVNDQSFIMYDYATRTAYFQNLMQTPDAVWQWADVVLSAGDAPGFVERELPFFAYGPIITRNLEGERLDRILEYFNWAATPEGIRFHTLGIEGETFVNVDGSPSFMDATTKHEHFQKSGFMEFLKTDEEYVASDPDRQTDLAVSAAFAEEPHAPFTAFNLSEEDQELANSMITGITDIARQFTVQVIMGQVDIEDDSVWNQYLQNLNQAGLEQLLEIYRAAVQ